MLSNFISITNINISILKFDMSRVKNRFQVNIAQTWYWVQLKQCQQHISPSTYFFTWPRSHGRLQTDSGGLGLPNLNWISEWYKCYILWYKSFQAANITVKISYLTINIITLFYNFVNLIRVWDISLFLLIKH